MQLDSLQFGKVAYQADQVIEFAEGLLGFPHLHRLLHLVPKEWEPVEFLLPLDEPGLAFPMLNPFLVRPEGYTFDIPEADQASLGVAKSAGIAVYAITTFGSSVEDSTLNLLAPVLINPVTHLGRQIVLENTAYSVNERLVKSRKGAHDAGHPAQAR